MFSTEDYIYDINTKKNIHVIADVIVIGGGIAGLTAADKLAEVGTTCAIFEQRKTFMSDTSRINLECAGLGFDSVDEPTALAYLKTTIDFIKKYKKQGHDFRVGAHKFIKNDAMRRGRYFIPNDSLIRASRLAQIYQAIVNEYERLIELDPDNQVLGKPSLIYQMIAIEDYVDDIVANNITMAFQTGEQLLDVSRFRGYLISKITNTKNIKSFTEAKVIHIERTNDAKHYIVTVEHDGKIKKYAAPQLINSSHATTHVKVFAKVKLPGSLKKKPCMSFLQGQFCMFFNMQDGTGMISYAPKSNCITREDESALGQEIIDGVAKYIPAMIHAELIEVLRVVDEFNIQELEIGAIEISSMKLLYGSENAEKVNALLGLFKQVEDTIITMSADLEKYYTSIFTYSNVSGIFLNYIEYFLKAFMGLHLNLKPTSVSTSVLQDYFSIYLKRHSMTKDMINLNNKQAIMYQMQETIKNKTKFIKSINVDNQSKLKKLIKM